VHLWHRYNAKELGEACAGHGTKPFQDGTEELK
jgi:hypothetical protein